uniref:hypothetical protein n=1 Tax=Cupriavidus gilardii TaxID=82541 RepID=UPI0024784E26|nr:hypothetical protein [Cupriavidus gilardii]WDE72684.1 hypothetical protein [Cupriavidus gilardii]
MATTSYFEQDVPVADESADASQDHRRLELYITSFSGRHQLYLKTEDANGEETDLVLSKEQARALADGLDRAMGYLGYRD